jgi:hypothetical protein
MIFLQIEGPCLWLIRLPEIDNEIMANAFSGYGLGHGGNLADVIREGNNPPIAINQRWHHKKSYDWLPANRYLSTSGGIGTPDLLST